MLKQDKQFLIRHYNIINKCLSSNKIDDEEFESIIVYFIIVVERLLKIKLYKKNRVLVFSNDNFNNNDFLEKFTKGKLDDQCKTVGFRNLLDRYCKILKQPPNIINDVQKKTLIDVYEIRNVLVHSWKQNVKILNKKQDIIKKIGSIWPQISQMAISVFGKKEIQQNEPIRKYTEEELSLMFEDEIREKIKSGKYKITKLPSFFNNISWNEYTCPRCGTAGFFQEKNTDDWLMVSNGLYKCNHCGLELTEKEFEIAQKINYKDNNSMNSILKHN